MKKIWVFLATIVILVGLAGSSIMPTYATTAHSVAEAVDWAKSQEGQSLNYDGVFGAQCVDLIAYYYSYLGHITPGGNAIDYASNQLPSGWTRVYGDYHAGDIAVWYANHSCSSCYTGVNGHIGIITDVGTTTFNTIDQNGPNNKGYCKANTYPISALKCAIRPDFSNVVAYNPFSSASASNISNTNAQINAELSSVQYVTEGGFFISKSADMSNHTQVKETLNTSVKSMWYDMNKWYGTLDAGTTYYYQLYAIINGTQYFTGVQSFTTTGNSVTSAFPLVDGQYYYIYNRNAGRVLDIENTAEGAKVILNDKMAGNTNQMWKAVKHSDGYSFISCTTGYAMDVYGYSTEDYTEIKQYAYHGNTNQRFQIIDRGEGYYSIHPICSGLGLDAYNADTAPGTKIIQYGYHGGTNMQWSFETVDNVNPTISNVRVEQMTDTSCWIMCEVTDNVGVSRVSFPTWTEYNGQDDLAQNWPTTYIPISGNTYGFKVDIAEHNNEEGKYTTHIYAYDQAGNYAVAGIVFDILKASISLNIQADADEQTTIQLLNASGSEVKSTNVTGSNSNLQLTGVVAGTYTLRVSKTNCATRTYTINVGQGVVQQDIELQLLGDITGDDTINARDKKMLYNHIAGTAILEDYDFVVGDVTGDGTLNARDKKMIYNHIAGTASLWE